MQFGCPCRLIAARKVKKEKTRLERSTNASLLAEEKTKLELVEQVCTASKDLASIFSGSVKSADEVVEKVAACDAAGVVLSSFARAECVKAFCDIQMRFQKYDDFLNILTDSSVHVKQLEDSGMERSQVDDIANDLVERHVIAAIEAIPQKDHTTKAATKAKEETCKFLDAVMGACSKKDFLPSASGIREQVEVAWSQH